MNLIFPELRIGWLNGWIFLALLSLTDITLFLIFPKQVVRRLFDRSGWSTKQKFYTVMGKLCALLCLLLIIFTPLKTRSVVFSVGLVLALLGIAGLVKALVDFKNTPLGEPVTRGLYRLSRHPQIVMSSLVILGACVAIGSWLALALFVCAKFFEHLGVVAEEEVCLKQYGEAYRAYLQQTPRYFVFF